VAERPHAALRVRALGPLEIAVGERPLTGGWGATRARELLLLLLCHPAGMTKEQVGAALWPEASTAQVRNSFHVTLHRLRKALGDEVPIVAEDDRYRLDPAVPCELDAVRFEAQLAAALANGAGVEPLEAALALYRGPLFDGEAVGEWHLERRERLQERFHAGLLALAAAHAEAGRAREAADAYRRLLASDPMHEDACRGLMTTLARLGERAQALRAYRDVASRLWDELGTEPDPETTELFERLQAGARL
jgi:DNA-binding SARP family transcriptional activator